MLSKSALTNLILILFLVAVLISYSSAEYCDPQNLTHTILCNDEVTTDCVNPREVICKKQCFNQDYPIYLDVRYYSQSELKLQFKNVNTSNGVCITGKLEHILNILLPFRRATKFDQGKVVLRREYDVR